MTTALQETSQKSDVEALFRLLPAAKAQRVIAFAEALKVFGEATDKARAAAEISRRFAPMGLKGLSAKSLYRKYQDVAFGGILMLVDPRTRRLAAGNGLNEEFKEYWHSIVLANRRKMRPAWGELLRRLSSGVEIPGVGTWKDLYLRVFGYQPSAGEPCPWNQLNPPEGWSYRNMVQLAPSKATRFAASRGAGEAQLKYGFTVKKTRVGLKCCQVVEVDDMWYEHKVIYGGNREPQRVVEFAALDRLTGHVICYLPKPVRERDDNTKETLKSAWVRYVYAYVLCVTGVPEGGCVIKGEHGSAAADQVFSAALAAINAERIAAGLGEVAFRAGAILPRSLAKGTYEAAAKGNARNKGSIEQMHATLKHELGGIIGEVGGGRGFKPEAEYGMVAEAKKLIQIGSALEAKRPGISQRLRGAFLQYSDFAVAAAEAHERMDKRLVHELEGWEECGFTVGEIKFAGSAHWRTMPTLERIAPEKAKAMEALIASGAAEYRTRRMSPREAWESRKGELKPVGEFFAPLIMGEELSQVVKVNDKMQLNVRKADTGEKYTVAAVAGGNTLIRGAQYRVWVNPLDPCKAYVQNMQGQYIGTAPVMVAARADADDSVPELQRQLGLRSRVVAEEHRRLMPAIRQQLKTRNEAMKANIAEMGLEDPVEIVAAENQKRIELAASETADVELEVEEVVEPRELVGADALVGSGESEEFFDAVDGMDFSQN